MSDDKCIFCKIIAGEIPSMKVAESETCLAVLDAFPATRGHTLVLTKEHRENFLEMTDNEMREASMLLRDVGAAVKKVFDCPGINLVSNLGRRAGQVVMHAHFHVIPRYDDDSITMSYGQVLLTDEEKEQMRSDIAASMD